MNFTLSNKPLKCSCILKPLIQLVTGELIKISLTKTITVYCHSSRVNDSYLKNISFLKLHRNFETEMKLIELKLNQKIII